MQRLWAVGEANLRNSTIKAPDAATIGLAAELGKAAASAATPSRPPAPRGRGG
jgi:hypothetical protein